MGMRGTATAAIVVVALLTGCAPGALDPTPSTAAATSRAPRPSATPTPTPAPPTPQPVLLATLAASDGLAIVDPDAASPVLDVVTVGRAPWGVGATAGTAFVATAEGLALVDLATRSRTALVPYLHAAQLAPPGSDRFGEYRDGGLGIAISPDGDRVYVAVHRCPERAWLEVFDVQAGAFTGSAGVGVRPFDVLADPDGEWVATIDHDSYTVSLVDLATLTVEQVEIAPFGNFGFAGWEKPHYGALTRDGRIALPYQGLVTVLLDPETGTIERVEASANSHQHGTATAPDGRLVTVGTGPFGTATGATNVAFLDPVTGDEQVVPLERPHETAAIWQPDDGPWEAALAGGFTRDGWWDGLTLVDPVTGGIREMPLAGRPQHVIAAALPAVAAD